MGVKMSEAESNEMGRRMLMWFFYLLRNPFYDSYLKDSKMSQAAERLTSIPLLGSITGLLNYRILLCNMLSDLPFILRNGIGVP